MEIVVRLCLVRLVTRDFWFLVTVNPPIIRWPWAAPIQLTTVLLYWTYWSERTHRLECIYWMSGLKRMQTLNRVHIERIFAMNTFNRSETRHCSISLHSKAPIIHAMAQNFPNWTNSSFHPCALPEFEVVLFEPVCAWAGGEKPFLMVNYNEILHVLSPWHTSKIFILIMILIIFSHGMFAIAIKYNARMWLHLWVEKLIKE